MSYAWNWTEVCATGLQPWLPPPSTSNHSGADTTRHLAPCFQKIALEAPLLVLLTIGSAFRLGIMQPNRRHRWQRDRVQLWALSARQLAVGLLAVLPLIRYIYVRNEDREPVDVWLGGVEMLAYSLHFMYLRSLRSLGPATHRGPLGLNVCWITLYVLAGSALSDPQWLTVWPVLVAALLLHTVYAISLLPAGSAEAVVIHLGTDDDELLMNAQQQPLHPDDRPLGVALDRANILDRLTFGWVTPLIKKGLRPEGLRTIDDLFELPSFLHIAPLAERMKLALSRSPRLLWALHRAHGFEFYAIGVFRLIGDVSGFAGPLLLGALLSHTAPSVADDDDGNPLADAPFDAMPFWYALGLFGSTFISAMSSTYFDWRLRVLIARMNVSMVSAIYTKALEARSLDDAKPEIVNLMSTDANRVANASYAFHALWSVPLQIIVTLYLLYTQVGVACLAGVVFVLTLLPINHFVVKKINEYETLMLEQRDKRMAICSEVLGAAKTVKLMAWETVFTGRIGAIRIKEISMLRRNMNLNAVVTYLWTATPMLMCLLTFGTSVLMGHQLTAATTFTSVSLLNMLMGPLNIVPWALNGLTNAWVSLRRIQELLDLPSIDLLAYYSHVSFAALTSAADDDAANPSVVLQLQNATFDFEQPRNRDGVDAEQAADIVDFRLRSISLTVHRGEIVCLKGALGSGKSTLLAAILARMRLADDGGTVALADIAGGFGYVAQTAWLQRGTVRDNILWGAPFDEQFYKEVLFACALIEDLTALGGDLTGVGESGQTLSGGQRARVALARAVYQKKDLYVLDDILAALDGHVASHIIRHCIFGVLARKTRIVVSEHVTLLAYADQVLELNGDGNVIPVLDRVKPEVDRNSWMHGATEEYNLAMSTFELRQDEAKVRETGDTVLEEENQEFGTVSSGVVVMYARACGVCAIASVLAMLVAQRMSESATDLWLAHWVSENTNVNRTGEWLFLSDPVNPTNWWNLEVYAGLAAANSLATLIGAFVFAIATVRASRLIHERMLKSVFATHFQFFDVTPLGRMLNRFSSDIDYTDQWLPFNISYLMSQVSSLVACLAVTVAALPWITLLVGPFTPVYLSLQSRYRNASREIRRLSSNAMSPLYAHFTETLQGLATVRAMRAAQRFRGDFLAKMERSMRAQLAGYAAETWLTIRLQSMGSMLVGGCGLVSAMTAQHASNPGIVGLAISYALSITSLLEGVMFAVAQTEQQLIAVERIKEYCELEPEDENDNSDDTTPMNFATVVDDKWPETGCVRFEKARLQYRANLTPALLDVTLEARAGERLGIAGRTGAGKSSLLSALFRVAPLSGGRVRVDGVDVSTLPVRLLRSRMSLVPQQAFLFAGTVRDNVDVQATGESDAEIWRVLERCHAAEMVRGLGGLDGKLEKGGGNVSAGQKQLLCLARALLRGSRLVCIDEGTANLDAKAEKEVQLVLREAFEGATVLLIAHRMTSLVQSDRVAVMRAGEVVELGAVRELTDDEGSMFAAMMREQAGGQGAEDGELTADVVPNGSDDVEKLVDV